ncbi:germin-like protein 1-1 [Lactuca sativa]|uniref:Germin-like protein n=1 Tax=Lactuca sativa TaxID=4236 RepID=A0A9R1V5N3_LACSA|nr:germin-like protein 1-1 [Lactuca sativa]KAJ0198686.1 hypothetical protein LSAT_V11C600336010 [Lactuca sativa]
MATTNYLSAISMTMIIFFASYVSTDPDMLQDVCAADFTNDDLIKLNGFLCKKHASSDDFFFSGLSYPRSTDNTFGATPTLITVLNISGLNTLGMAVSRIDFAPGGLNPPHLHPRASEIFFVLEGELEVAFITTDNKLYYKPVKGGELFVLPKGLIHFQINRGNESAVAIAAFNSQFPGIQRVPNALFGSYPDVPNDVLAKTFGIGINQVKKIKSWLDS